jgi:hypothetical protein
MLVSCECCVEQVEVSAMGRSLVQGSPAECVCVIECDEAHLQDVGRRVQT